MASGVDYAWSHPSPASLKTFGATFACRYLATDKTKSLTKAEATALAAVGIWSVVVWESTANRMLGGNAAGVADAKAAQAQATAAGQPADRPIYFAADWDATEAQQTQINAYLDGAASILGRARVGIYGGYYPVKRALDAGKAVWAWQTIAWSGGQWDSRVHIRQGAQKAIGGVSCDLNTSMTTDFGQWMPGKTPEDDVALSDADKTWLTNAINSAIAAKITTGVWHTDGAVPAARPPYNNSDYYKADGKTLGNTAWTAGYAAQTTVEGVRQAVALLTEIKATLGAIGAGGLADQIAADLAKLDITLNVKES